MALAYRPPGVNVNEIVTTTISPILSSPGTPCLVGRATGVQTRTDQFLLTGTTLTPLPGLSVGSSLSSILSVKDALDPSKGASDGSGYLVTTDYTVTTGLSGGITRVGAGGIATNTLVNVTYTYVASDYFLPTLMTNMGSVESKYGPALNNAGTAINSALSYAASCAFENGASSVVCQALFVRQTPGNPATDAQQPTDTSAATLSTWQDTLYNLRDIEDINILVPIIGQSMPNVGDSVQVSIFQAVEDHLAYMNVSQQYIFAIFGEDNSASSTVATQTIIQSHATTLRGRHGGATAEQIAIINTASFQRPSTQMGQYISVGGQYLAAAVAGMLSSFPVSVALTRKAISGFVKVLDTRDGQQKNADAGAGLMVIEQKGSNTIIRHGITINNTGGAAKAEVSVVRAKHRMIESVRDTIDRQIVGQIIADANAPNIVANTVSAVLEGLRQNRDLVDYTAVESQYTSLDPTMINVRFAYRPAFPLNYVNIEFSLNLSSATVSVLTGNKSLSSGT
jgi:hypothetical protein